MSKFMNFFCCMAGRRLLPLWCLVAAASMASADLKVVSQVQMSVNGDYRTPEFATTYYKGNWVRMDSKNRSVLNNSSTHRTIEVDHLKKTYSSGSSDLASQAAMLMQFMDAKVTAKVTPTDDQKEIVGVTATKYIAEFDFEVKLPQAGNKPVHMKIRMENWATTELPIKAEAGSAMGAPNDLLQSLMTLTGIGEVRKELLKIKGFSLWNRITTTMDSPDTPAPISFEIDYQAIKISTSTISPAMFVVPQEYRNESPDDVPEHDWQLPKKEG
jgi:hypothetical protein